VKIRRRARLRSAFELGKKTAPGTVVAAGPALWASRTFRERLHRGLATLLILCGAAVVLVPFWWMVRTSLMSMGEIFIQPIRWIPTEVLWHNYVDAWTAGPFTRYSWNSIRVSFLATAGTVITASLTAYGFARLRAPGRDIIFIVLLSTLMLPNVVTLVPTYLLFRYLGWLDTYMPLIAPYWFGGGAFYIFLLRQFLMTLPRELDEAATIDGCGYFGTYWRIIVPLSLPGHATIAIFAFYAHWNEFFVPLIYLNSFEKYTLPVGLRFFQGAYNVIQWHWLMAVSLIVMLPCLLIFLLVQRHFVQGVVLTGIKG
jgi:ABC-type glycerol-3-phosphate transport system permease component